MLTIREIKEKKAACGYTNEQLSQLSGVPLSTVQKILGNVTKSPRYESLRALSAVFEKADKKNSYELEGTPSHLEESPLNYNSFRGPLSENTHDYDRQGSYTLVDYLALPDEQRVELIDGVFYDMSSPSVPHQLIGGAIYAQLLAYIKKKKSSCVPLIAPADVQLDCDNRTIVQPDVMIVCDRSKIHRNRVFGAPDFIIEVLSPSTKNKDILIKGAKYQNAGVKEYWLIDPMQQTVLVFDFRQETLIKMYSFDDTIPVTLYDGDLTIDMKEIADYISFIRE